MQRLLELCFLKPGSYRIERDGLHPTHSVYGRAITMIVPSADDMQLYQPTHKLAGNL
ncbi:MAG TPA: hypothetical protein VGF73_07920 [Chthoniobacterales bacterium]